VLVTAIVSFVFILMKSVFFFLDHRCRGYSLSSLGASVDNRYAREPEYVCFGLLRAKCRQQNRIANSSQQLTAAVCGVMVEPCGEIRCEAP
jgi:hypothetical protein